MAFAPVVLLLAFGLSAMWLRRQATDDSRWVRHTEAVIDATALLASHMRDVESGQRGFIITGDSEYLNPYVLAHDSVSLDLAHLASITSENPVQQALIAKLKPVIAGKIGRIDTTIAIRGAGHADSALAMIRAGVGRRLMDSTLTLLGAMRKEEARLLEIRAAKEESSRRLMFVALIGGVALSALFSMLISIRLSDQAVQQWLTSAELASRNKALLEQARDYEQTIAELRSRTSGKHDAVRKDP